MPQNTLLPSRLSLTLHFLCTINKHVNIFLPFYRYCYLSDSFLNFCILQPYLLLKWKDPGTHYVVCSGSTNTTCLPTPPAFLNVFFSLTGNVIAFMNDPESFCINCNVQCERRCVCVAVYVSCMRHCSYFKPLYLSKMYDLVLPTQMAMWWAVHAMVMLSTCARECMCVCVCLHWMTGLSV